MGLRLHHPHLGVGQRPVLLPSLASTAAHRVVRGVVGGHLERSKKYKLVGTGVTVGTCGGATTGGALYSLLLLSVPVGNLFCGGVGGLVVGAGPAEVWDTLPRLPYWVF